MSEEYEGLTGIALFGTALRERLERIEKHLGITEPTPAQAEWDQWSANNDEEDA